MLRVALRGLVISLPDPAGGICSAVLLGSDNSNTIPRRRLLFSGDMFRPTFLSVRNSYVFVLYALLKTD